MIKTNVTSEAKILNVDPEYEDDWSNTMQGDLVIASLRSFRNPG